MSATETVATNAIRSYFVTGWNNLTPIERPNVGLEPPSPDPSSPSTSSWIRISFENAMTMQAHLNSADEFADGAFNVQVFTPENADEAYGLSLAETAKALLKRVTIGAAGVTFKTPTISRVPTAADTPWYLINVRAPYWRM